MKFFYFMLPLFIFVSCDNSQNLERDNLLPETKNRITCEIFLSKITQKIKEKLKCDKYFLRDLDEVMPTNCENKTDRLDRICKHLLNELRIDTTKWKCDVVKPLSEKDKEELCKIFAKSE
jgi:hypothetical protein